MTLRRLFTGAAVVLGVAVLAPLAIAGDRPDDRADRTSVGTLSGGAGTFDPIGTADTVEARLRAGLDARGSQIVPIRPDDRAGRIGVGSVEQPAPTEPVASTGRDWTDASTIGWIAAAVALIGVVLIYGVEHRRGGGGGARGTPRTPTVAH